MAELGLSPSARRARLRIAGGAGGPEPVTKIEFVTVFRDADGHEVGKPVDVTGPRPDIRHEIDGRL